MNIENVNEQLEIISIWLSVNSLKLAIMCLIALVGIREATRNR